MSYVYIVSIFNAKGKKYATTTERINQHGSRYFMLVELPENVIVKQFEQIDKKIVRQWPVIASTDSPYKKPLKTARRRLLNNS